MKYLILIVTMLICCVALADDNIIQISVSPMDENTCLKSSELLAWDNEKSLCYFKLSTVAGDWVKIYIDKNYHLTTQQGKVNP